MICPESGSKRSRQTCLDLIGDDGSRSQLCADLVCSDGIKVDEA
jgi:hypothetical protein